MSEIRRAVLVIAISGLAGAIGYWFWLRPFIQGQPAVEKVLGERSTWSVTMQAYYASGPLSAETYRLSNDNGKLSMFYSASDRPGTVTKQFAVPLTGPGGTFLFEQLRADGLWELDDKPVRNRWRDEYIVVVTQTLGDEGGSRAFGFSDPVYWATTSAKEYKLDLKRAGAAPATRIGVSSTPLKDDRYLRIVSAIRSFGPESVLQAEQTIRAELAAPAAARKSVKSLKPVRQGTSSASRPGQATSAPRRSTTSP